MSNKREVWNHLPDDALREHIRSNRAAADAMQAELDARHAPVVLAVPRSLLQRVQHVLLRPGLAQGELTWEQKQQLSEMVSEALTGTSVVPRPEVTRFEVIDRSVGRICTYDACTVELSCQDEGRTLKVFVERTGSHD